MAVIRQLKNWFTGQIIHPVTRTKAVYTDDNRRLDNILDSIAPSNKLDGVDLGSSFNDYISNIVKNGNLHGAFIVTNITDTSNIPAGLPLDICVDGSGEYFICEYTCVNTNVGTSGFTEEVDWRSDDVIVRLTSVTGKVAYIGVGRFCEAAKSNTMIFWKKLTTTDVSVKS